MKDRCIHAVSVTDASGAAIQHLEIDRREIREPPLKLQQGREQYMAFGEVFVDERRTGFGTPYKFNAKELDCESGYYYYGARYYDPRMARFLSVDPLAGTPANVGWSSYTYVWNNPLKFIDPDGRHGETTIVGDNGDGTYSVKGWIDDESADVELEDGTKVGESVTTHSFVDANNQPVIGAIIDPNSSEGQNFLDNEIIGTDIGLVDYMSKSYTVGKPLDFKSRNEDQRGSLSRQQHRYRGSMTSDGKMGSARDFGNMAAGIVAGRQGIGWSLTELAFNSLQGGQEPPVSAKAQRVGHNIGIQLNRQDRVNLGLHYYNLMKQGKYERE